MVASPCRMKGKYAFSLVLRFLLYLMSSSVKNTAMVESESSGRPASKDEEYSLNDEKHRWHDACSLAKLRRARRIHIQVEGRYVSVIIDPSAKRYHEPSQRADASPPIYCLDSICYHMGGPLTTGDIEEIEGIPCLSCPWHSYKIDLRDGTRLSRPVTFDPKTRQPIPGKWESGPRCVQRIHDVRCTEDGQVQVRILDNGEVPSDKYAYSDRAARNLVGGASNFRKLDSSRPSECVLEEESISRCAKRRLHTPPPDGFSMN